MKNIHILGICGTFMAGVAVLAKQLGYTVSGSDQNVYPPMSTQLEAQGIQCYQGYLPEHLQPHPDLVVIGNALSRGNPAVEYVLAAGIPYVSGPEWLSNALLRDRWVLAVAGTHGKTTTSSLLAHILTHQQMNPGFLIGGVPQNFSVSAHLGQKYFVIEADEYDSAFFDKRSKFIHYRPKTLIMNNLEYDHADIFPDLAAIQLQFQYLLRTVPNNGQVIYPMADENLAAVLQKGVWTPTITIGLEQGEWQARLSKSDGSEFSVWHQGKNQGTVQWNMIGKHNVQNALAAIAASAHVGISGKNAINALNEFAGVKRRMEIRGQMNGITVYDDFAHHPTAIETTLEGLREKVGKARIIAILECASNTMKQGIHAQQLIPSLHHADTTYILQPDWEIPGVRAGVELLASTNDIITRVSKEAKSGDHIIVMSNKGFEGIHQRLLTALAN